MEVTGIDVYTVDLPIAEGTYDWAGGNSYAEFDSTILRLRTDEGVAGWGEVAMLGSAYLPAFGRGARAGVAELADEVLGADPTQPAVLAERLDARLRGHPYVKSALDVACWDLTGKVRDAPVADLLGGRFGDEVDLYRAISQGTPAEMADSVATYRDQGYGAFQLKVGEDPVTDAERIRAARAELEARHVLDADFNTGLTRHEAVRVVDAVSDVDVYVEQPCDSYEACRAVRRQTDKPFVLDEVMTGVDAVLRGYGDDAMDVVNLKISKVGGLTRARAIRDLCADLGVAMIVEDTWGSEVATAAIAHLAHSTPADARFAATDFHNYNAVTTADGAPPAAGGTMAASTDPGLGVEPRLDVLGDPVAVYE
ncbi:cis-3-hydroxy-L-proline dehydratase [Halobacterium yunchengense]|uniref:cis-3-hydroxy-L-proline dehydratase n=1 Tax=Halobacterium yunchengense TaxID=3108497 RepID=UPI00300AAC94